MADSNPMARLAKIEQDVGVLKQDVGVLKQDVGVLKQDVGDLKHDVGDLKQAVLQITEVLVDQSNRMDSGFRAVREEALELRRSLTERLDRLIAVTVEERTQSFGRLRDLERRVERLEERVGTT